MAAPVERSRRRRRRILIALLAPLVGVLACELLLRWLVLSPSGPAVSLGARFRDAALYVPSTSSDEYQRLRARIGPFLPNNTSVPQPEVGWVNRHIDPLTLVHEDEGALAGRRPVLLFGSSFTSCWHPREVCYQGLFDASPLGREYALLNFGVSGYGPDQTLLLASRVVERFASADPIVIFSFVVDTDLSRATMSVFQTPKPRFVRQEDGWKLELPDTTDLGEYARRHPAGIKSYLWRYLKHGVGLFPEGDTQALQRRHRDERFEVTLYCLKEFVARMRARGLAHFVLLFHSQGTYDEELPGVAGDQKRVLRALEKGGVPWVDSRQEVRAHLATNGGHAGALFEAEHPNRTGTEVLFGALMRGLAPLVEDR